MDDQRLVDAIESLSEDQTPSSSLAPRVHDNVILVSVGKALVQFYLSLFTFIAFGRTRSGEQDQAEDEKE